MDLSIGKGQSLLEEHSQLPCLGYLAIAVHQDAGTILIIQDQNLSRILEPFKHITRENMGSSLSCAENVARLSLLEVIGEPMRRTVGSFGIAFVDLISSTKGLSKIISSHSVMAMQLTVSTPLKKKKKKNQPLKLSKRMNLLGERN